MSTIQSVRRRSALPTRPVLALAAAAFVVGCDGVKPVEPPPPPTTGSIQVAVTTTGADLDPDGYAITVDGANNQQVGAEGSVTFSDLQPGDRNIGIQGVADNCSVSGENPRAVMVTAGQTAETSFEVDCTAVNGNLEVNVVTTGDDPDPDGYMVSVAGGAGQPLDVNGSITIVTAAGDTSVELSGVADNCSVTGDNPRTVSVPAGGAVQTTFVVTCTSLTGSLVITATTTGEDVDPDGYTVTVNGGTGQPLATNGTNTLNNIPAGPRSIHLSGVANNCTVAGDNPRTATVPVNGTVQVDFVVTCVLITGDIVVITSTIGQDLDPEGYTVSVDGQPSQAVGVNDTVTVTGVVVGDHTVQLLNVASNCTVVGDNPQTVNVPGEGSVEAVFAVICGVPTGTLEVVAVTTGADPDPDGYTISVDGGPAHAVGTNDTLAIATTTGQINVQLGGVADNCAVTGVNPRTVTVPAGGTAQTTFVIACSSFTGSLVITTTTSGDDPDPDGYTVSVEGKADTTIGSNGTITLNDVSSGLRSVELKGVANNCTVADDNPRTVTVLEDATVQTNFVITCVPIVGSVTVTTSTAGSDRDPDGYTVSVEGMPDQAIGINETIVIPGVRMGSRSVELKGVAGNCSVSGDNPLTVTVPGEGNVQATFVVVCAPLTGSLEVAAVTTGDDLDPDGYTVSVDGGPAQALATNGSVTISGVTAGDRSVQLSGLAGNCTVSGANPQTVTVPGGGSVSATFNISCVALTGNVEVTTSTSGVSLDPDGYTVSVEGMPDQAIGINETIVIADVSVGSRNVELSGVASNCSVTGDNPRTVAVTDGGTVPTTFTVTCVLTLRNKIVFDTDRDGNKEIYGINPDGTGLIRLTNNSAAETQPSVSHDGTKILFSSDRDGNSEIYVMNADGTGETRLTNASGSDKNAQWSPDGTKIVFVSDRDGDFEVYVMNADGTGVTSLTSNAVEESFPVWSPDGSKVVFGSRRDGTSQIYLVNADGTGVQRLTNNSANDFDPSWAPDGSAIIFASDRDATAREIYRMNTDGSGQVNLTNDGADDLSPSWSPSSAQIAFTTSRDGNHEIYIMNADGSGLIRLTVNAAKDFELDWSR